MAIKTTYNCDTITGGATRALDDISVVGLLDGDRAICHISGDEMIYFEFQDLATDEEDTSAHPYKVRPDDYATEGEGVWYEQAHVHNAVYAG